MKTGLNNASLRKSISAIVVNRDGGAALWRCLESLAGQRGVELETVVIDNASRPEEVREIRSRFPRFRLVPFTLNFGFARGVNEGIARSSGEFILTLNNDARLAPDYCARLAERLSGQSRLAAVQGLILTGDGKTIDGAGIVWNARGEALPDLSGLPAESAPSECAEVAGVSATAAMYRRLALLEVAEESGVFDDSFFAYYEDADLSLRLARSGWKFLLDPGAVANHEGSLTGHRTPWRRARWIARNRWKTLLKNFDRGFLRRRLFGLVRADLAHARALGAVGLILPFAIWPRALAEALLSAPGESPLSGFPRPGPLAR
jgi:GT2 family glycosyltransferase